ncbi:glycosyltransferase family 2 protein [Agrobacterium sp. DE0009]|uniref:glycosyltransferase family 2 protein n=1 Tax=Agrobacterium sp. DE0009 TaxID=2587505 RepID=UPI00119E3080|nr:glycosyltransferase family 2 protein [Agrobacterium sp. DE0009]
MFMQAFRAPFPATSNNVCSAHADGCDGASVKPIPDFAVIVPMHNEEASVETLVGEIVAACRPVGNFEIVVVDDASSDDTVRAVLSLADDYPMLRLVRHDRQGGQSAAIHSGVQAARAPIVCMLDGDGQNPPDNLPTLLGPLLSATAPQRLGLVAGQRVGRRDTLAKRLSSRFANQLRARILKDGTRDTGCGLKAFRRDAYLALPYFDHHHRYFPALFCRDGWQVAHVDVTHRPRLHGNSHYTNIGRALVGIYDLIGVAWLLRRRKRSNWAETFITETSP